MTAVPEANSLMPLMNSTTQSAPQQLADYHWLVEAEAATWLAEARETLRISGQNGLVRLAAELREALSANRVHLILEQVQLREKAREKFPQADRMFFTPLGLQQATDAWIAAYKACRFARGEPVADLCCGIGGDLMALAARGPVQGVDRDPASAILVEANVRSAQANAVVSVADVAKVSLSEVAAWHIDPDRRPGGRRTTKVDLHEPGPEVLAGLLAACPHAAIKLAPAATFDEPWWADAELEWISRDRECRQLVAWFGRLARSSGRRSATIVRSSESTTAATFVGEENVSCAIAAQIGRYLFEPDPAVLAAKLEARWLPINNYPPLRMEWHISPPTERPIIRHWLASKCRK